ncbi:hypothetical protein ACFVTP_00515 [Streptomyces celluloflavus]|uniref:hypothetical protein n=1 Tax=Streptomyces celluloflavus TaxID=58344 RepID=UPI0036D97F27
MKATEVPVLERIDFLLVTAFERDEYSYGTFRAGIDNFRPIVTTLRRAVCRGAICVSARSEALCFRT